MYKLNILRQQELASFKNLANILLEYNSNRLKDLSPTELANAIWSLVKLGHHNKEFEEKWLDVASGKSLDEFNKQELMNIMWSFAELKLRRNPEIELEYEAHIIYEEKLSSYVYDKLDAFNYKELVNILRSCIIFREAEQEFVDNWINVVSNKSLDELNNEELVSLVSSFAKLKDFIYIDEYEEYSNPLIERVSDIFDELNIKQIIDVIKDFDILESYDEDFIYTLDDVVSRKLNEFALPELLTILNFIDNNGDCISLKEILRDKIISMLNNLTIKELVDFTSNICLDQDHFVPAWEAVCIKELNKFTTQELVKTIDIFSKFQLKNGGFIGTWINEATSRLSEFSPEELIRSINTFASLGHIFAERIDKQKLKECGRQELAVILRSLANNTPFDKSLTKLLLDTNYLEDTFISKENNRRHVSFNPNNEYTSEGSNFIQRVTEWSFFSLQPGPSHL